MVSQLLALNKILNTKDFSLVTNNALTADYFSNYSAEFNYIKNHIELYHTVPDKLTFLGVFPDFEINDVSEPDAFLIEQLYEDYNNEYMAASFNKVKKLLESGNSQEAYNTFLTMPDGLKKGSAMTCIDLLTDTSRFDRYQERMTNQAKYYLSTGFPELDRITGGIDCENEDMVIIARPGVGKSFVLFKIAAAASMQGKRVGIYSGEMTCDKVGYRIDTIISGIQNTSINRGDPYVQAEYKRYIKSLPEKHYGPIKIFTPSDVAGEVTVDTLRAFIEREQLDILFVDQYSLLEDNQRARTDFEHIGNIAKAIKKLQVEKRIPIISVSQMNRTKNENGEQDTTQVAGSDKIPQYATTVIALEQKKIEGDDEHAVTLTLNIIKARDGGDGNKLAYRVKFNTGVFNYIPSADDHVTTEADYAAVENSYQEPYPADDDCPF